MDWNNWIDNMFESATEGMKNCCPKERPVEWEYFWEVVVSYKKWKESGMHYKDFRSKDINAEG